MQEGPFRAAQCEGTGNDVRSLGQSNPDTIHLGLSNAAEAEVHDVLSDLRRFSTTYKRRFVLVPELIPEALELLSSSQAPPINPVTERVIRNESNTTACSRAVGEPRTASNGAVSMTLSVHLPHGRLATSGGIETTCTVEEVINLKHDYRRMVDLLTGIERKQQLWVAAGVPMRWVLAAS
ncbi:hypothetical protein BD309DRAFT_973338 [Dichomitus squalens]|uniref:Uncharacterized protein n=1 Tax=Dichomitus squalens TaxID=114155 RepID=A0A4Q9NE27_9APHY|nr:hypothetical protein BD309DRAFT_973338 [Dichomitus squalens]TBU53433.1 hypothetical protein BD310DRAFT_970305 [Dichomitus squalens]